jgi:hypothetical protein
MTGRLLEFPCRAFAGSVPSSWVTGSVREGFGEAPGFIGPRRPS